MLDQRGQFLRAAEDSLGALCPHMTKHSVPGWTRGVGLGRVPAGTHCEGFDLQLTQYDEREWTFYTTGMEHSPTSATGTAWERTPWRAAQRAAWGALKKLTLG